MEDETIELVERVYQEYECFICGDIMRTPIKICVTGHSFCSECFEQIPACPICKAAKAATGRNYCMEQLTDIFVYRCRNHAEGCTYKMKLSSVDDHEMICTYSITECPLDTVNRCLWEDRIGNMFQHCLENHPNNTCDGDKQTFVCFDFLEPPTRDFHIKHYFIVFRVFDKLFRCIWDMNTKSGFIQWRVVYLGPKADAAKYKFKVKFQHPTDNNAVFSLHGRCQSYELREMYRNNMFVTSNRSVLANYCIAGNLKYTMTIHENNNEWDGTENLLAIESEEKITGDGRLQVPDVCLCSKGMGACL